MDRAAVGYIPLTNEWEVLDDFRFSGYGVDLLIPAGFHTDLASIPRILWRLIAPYELSIEAALVHDWLYRHGGRHLHGTVDRLAADGIFREIMIAQGVPAWRCAVAYRGVRLFGGWSWQEEGACTQAE